MSEEILRSVPLAHKFQALSDAVDDLFRRVEELERKVDELGQRVG